MSVSKRWQLLHDNNEHRLSVLQKRDGFLGFEFGRYVREHPEFLEKIPQNAQIVLFLDGDDEFNSWSRHIGSKQAESIQTIFYITIKKLSPAHSRIEELSLATV